MPTSSRQRRTGCASQHYCRLLAEGCGVDEPSIWEWSFLERVSTGMYLMALGAPEFSKPSLDTAAMLL